MFISGSCNINSCGVDTAVTKNVGKLGNILFDAVKGTCEKVAQIMGKHLLRIYPCLLTKIFHFTPNVVSAHRLATSSYEDCTRCDFFALLHCLSFIHYHYFRTALKMLWQKARNKAP